jgi:hypothetical protein
MPNAMLRVKLAWSGFQGGPGVTSFYFNQLSDNLLWEPTQAEVDACAAGVTAFATALQSTVAPGVVLQTQTDCEVVLDEDGHLINILQAAPQAAKPSTAAAGAGYSGASGVVVNWRTSTIRKNRRMRGRTFIVPCQRDVYQGDGTLAVGTITGVNNAAAALSTQFAGPKLGVWGRPTRVKDPVTGKATGETIPDGLWGPVTATNVPDLAAVLRSRRD